MIEWYYDKARALYFCDSLPGVAVLHSEGFSRATVLALTGEHKWEAVSYLPFPQAITMAKYVAACVGIPFPEGYLRKVYTLSGGQPLATQEFVLRLNEAAGGEIPPIQVFSHELADPEAVIYINRLFSGDCTLKLIFSLEPLSPAELGAEGGDPLVCNGHPVDFACTPCQVKFFCKD